MSAALQMVTNGGDTEGLFRGAFMESGAVLPSGDINLGQQDYDNLVQAAGCSGAEDTLECLRQVPFPVLKEAVNTSPTFLSYRVRHDSTNLLSAVTNCILQSTNLVWVPRADGTFLKAPPQQLVLQGSVAKIPFVTGNKYSGALCSPIDRPTRPYYRQLRRRRNSFRTFQPQRCVSRSLGVRYFLLSILTPGRMRSSRSTSTITTSQQWAMMNSGRSSTSTLLVGFFYPFCGLWGN